MRQAKKIFVNMLAKSGILTAFVIAVVAVFSISLQNTTDVSAEIFTKTGGYSTSLTTKKDKTNEYSSYAKKLVLKANTFTLYGSMHYTKPGDVYSSKIYKQAKRTYKISGKCKFYKQSFRGGKSTMGKKKKISRGKLKKLILPLTKGTYSGRTLAWTIKDGVVTELICRIY